MLLRTFRLRTSRNLTLHQLPHPRPFSRTKPAHKMDTIRNTIAENFGGASHSLARPEHRFSLDDTPDQSGKIAVITGGSEGIGYGAAFTLLQHHLSKLFIISLSSDKMQSAIADVREKLGPETAKRIHWLGCDLADWKAVAETSQKIQSQTDRLDILILNAARGIMTYQLTPDTGVDLHMALNHMGHVVLTSHLLPLLKSTAANGNTVRISVQGSNAHQNAPSDTKFASLQELNRDLGPNGLYGRSKLANILYARYLARHLGAAQPRILVNATHPGFVETKQSVQDIHEAYPVAGYVVSGLLNPLKKDLWDGVVSTVFAATKVEEGGLYICPPAVPEEGSAMARDEALGERLMELTREVVGGKMGLGGEGKGCSLELY